MQHYSKIASRGNGVNKNTNGETTTERVVVVRYYLDRPGYNLDNSSARLWKNPPTVCTAVDIAAFLHQEGILKHGIASAQRRLLVEIYLDKFGSFMILEACGNDIEFDFARVTLEEPGILNIRLTDLMEEATVTASTSSAPQRCNTSPVGLFAFSLTLGLESADKLGTLVSGTVDESFVLIWGPYAFFVSGLLQLLVGLNEISRNNIYGATAFMAFGCFWLANGTKLILMNYFPDEIPESLFVASDPTGEFIRNMYIAVFVCILFKQTLVMNKLTTTLIGLLIIQLFATSVAGWSLAAEWIQMIMGWIVSLFAFFLSFAELTNEVYRREVINLYPWREGGPGEIFGAAGKVNALHSEAIELRTANRHLNRVAPASMRAVRPADTKED